MIHSTATTKNKKKVDKLRSYGTIVVVLYRTVTNEGNKIIEHAIERSTDTGTFYCTIILASTGTCYSLRSISREREGMR